MTSILDQDIMYLPGVGPKRKEILSKELNIQTWRDLLEYYPYKYVDRSKIYTIDELNGSIPFVQIKGKILSFEEFSNGTRRKRIVAHFSDGHGVVDLVWFRGTQYIYKTYALNTEYIVFGKPTVFGSRYQFAHPEIEKADELQLNEMGMQPYYSTTERMKTNGITSRTIEKLTKNLTSRLPKDAISETLPVFIQRPLHLISREAAFKGIHYPKSLDELQHAQVRLKFEELFMFSSISYDMPATIDANTEVMCFKEWGKSLILSTKITCRLTSQTPKSASCMSFVTTWRAANK